MGERSRRLDANIPSHHPDTGQKITAYEASEGKGLGLEAITERHKPVGTFTARLDKVSNKILKKN